MQLTQAIQDKSDALKRVEAIPTAVAQVAPQPVAAPVPVPITVPQPIPTVTVTFTPEPASAVSSPKELSKNVPNTTAAGESALAIGIDAPKITWVGKSLRVHFAIAYVRDDRGNQQGHIVVLARGPAALLAYPDEVLNMADTENLIVPAKGEYFSVSRFREVNAEFPPVRNQKEIREVETLIYDSDGHLLIHRKIPTP